MKAYFFLVVNSLLLLLLMSINFAFGFVQEAHDEARLMQEKMKRLESVEDSVIWWLIKYKAAKSRGPVSLGTRRAEGGLLIETRG